MKTIILAGVGRSGTTLSVEMLNASRRFQLLFEPLHNDYVPGVPSDPGSRALIHAHEKMPEYRAFFDRLFGGAISNEWVNRHGVNPHPDALLIKMIRANLMLGWLVAQYPNIKLLYQLRHPFATAESRLRYNFSDTPRIYTRQQRLQDSWLAPCLQSLEDETDPLLRHLIAWCIETALPMLQLEPEQYHPVFFEQLVADPRGVLQSIGEYLAESFGELEAAALAQPSSTASPLSKQRLARGDDVTRQWESRVTSEQLERGGDILESFGLSSLYGADGSLPDPTKIAAAREKLLSISRRSASKKARPPSTQVKPMKILAYGPYAAWQLHGMWEMTILQGLRVRGAEVQYVLCDGLYSDCDLHWKVTAPRDAASCISCQARSTAIASQLQMPFIWLGRYLPPTRQEEAHRWAQALPIEELPACRFGEWEIGKWVRSSVHSHLRRFTLDLDDPEFVQTYRSYVGSGLIAAWALDALMEESRPDVLVALSGRFSSIQIAMQLAAKRGIRVVAHERGIHRNSILMNHGPMREYDVFRRIWQDWGEVPLNRVEAEEILTYLADRRKAKWHSWYSFSPPAAETNQIREELDLAPDRPVWAMFLSSDDESADKTDRNIPFPIQDAWIEHTLAFAREHPEIQLVIRAHPNIQGKFLGTNHRLVNVLQELATRLPKNVRLVMPQEKISSYNLMEIATVGLVFRSTTGLEMACLGKRVIMGAIGYYANLPFVQSPASVEEYDHFLHEALQERGEVNHERQRYAIRFAHGALVKRNIRFPLIEMMDPHTGRPTFRTGADLAPGQDAGLDRACRIILDAEPIVLPPTEVDHQRSIEEETRSLEQAFRLPAEQQSADPPPVQAQKAISKEVADIFQLATRGHRQAARARLQRYLADTIPDPELRARTFEQMRQQIEVSS